MEKYDNYRGTYIYIYILGTKKNTFFSVNKLKTKLTYLSQEKFSNDS